MKGYSIEEAPVLALKNKKNPEGSNVYIARSLSALMAQKVDLPRNIYIILQTI
jgi:hypothetical protein